MFPDQNTKTKNVLLTAIVNSAKCTLKWKFREFYEILQILSYTWNAFPLGYQNCAATL